MNPNPNYNYNQLPFNQPATSFGYNHLPQNQQNQGYNPPPQDQQYQQYQQYPQYGQENQEEVSSMKSFENPLVKEKQDELRAIDHSLKKNFAWYLLWLWFDFVLNILWFVFFLKDFVMASTTKDIKMIASAFLTVFILITIAYGLSAYNGKLPDRQKKFITLLKWLIIFYILNIPVLILTNSSSMLIGRVVGILISVAVLYLAKDLEVVLRKRRELIYETDRLSYA